jgi:hypothetical protein
VLFLAAFWLGTELGACSVTLGALSRRMKEGCSLKVIDIV